MGQTKPNPKVIRSGPHALRFYESDGWTRDDVVGLVVSGEIKYFDDRPGYFVCLPGTTVDKGRLMASCVEFLPQAGAPADLSRMLEFIDVASGPTAGSDDPRNHPAYMAMSAVAEKTVAAFHNDYLVYDFDVVSRYPKAKFLYFTRDTGTDIVPLAPREEGTELSVKSMMVLRGLWDQNSRHYFWNGVSLVEIDDTYRDEVIRDHEPIAWQL